MYTIKTLHLEVTDKCNASCPMCARNENGGKVNYHLPLTELTLTDVKQMFSSDFIKQLDRMYMCGNYGDPIVAKDTLEIFRYFREHNPNMFLSMHTNGSARNREWWIDLSAIMGNRGYVTFGIDGLGDTHHLYRKGTNYEKIMQNAKTFIRHGGRARWDFIVFEHNEHQIEAARILADTLGFERFTTKKTGRFFSNTEMAGKGYREVLDNDGDTLYTISPPKNTEYQNKSLQKEEKLKEQYGTMKNYLNATEIVCQTREEQSIYVTAEGYVFPCCWTAGMMYIWFFPKYETEIWPLIKNNGGLDAINSKLHNITDIVKGTFFKAIENSWSCDSTEHGKLKVCAKTCGKQFNQFKDQF